MALYQIHCQDCDRKEITNNPDYYNNKCKSCGSLDIKITLEENLNIDPYQLPDDPPDEIVDWNIK